MRANPGGHIDPSDVLGRDALISRIWRVLERQSVLLTAERRMGKTCVIKKMAEEQRPSQVPLYRDLERVHSAREFVEGVCQDAEAHLRLHDKAAMKFRQLLKNIAGAEVGDVVKFPEHLAGQWKQLLTRIVEDLSEVPGRKLVFFWDEFPLMLENLRQSEGDRTVMEMLDVLRELRQTHRELRMVLTGSIGLHHVLQALRRVGYANDPTNDLYTFTVPPLTREDAEQLTRRLLDGEGLECSDSEACATAISHAVDGVAFYIHHVVDQLAQEGGIVATATVQHIVERAVMDPQDPWHLRYYHQRIETHWAPDLRNLALLHLDSLALSDDWLPFDELFNRVKARTATDDAEQGRTVLQMLLQDHYLLQDEQGRYGFARPFIRRAWRFNRGLQ